MKTALAAAVLMVPLAAGGAARAAAMTITITGVRDGRGVVRVAICPKAEFLAPHCPYFGVVAAKAGSVTVTIDGVPPGIFAAQAYQDSNDNGILDRNWLGMPKEGMGFSNDAPMHFGPPSFGDADFALGHADAHISFRLRYFSGP